MTGFLGLLVGLCGLVVGAIALLAVWKGRNVLRYIFEEKRVLDIDKSLVDTVSAHYKNTPVEKNIYWIKVRFCRGGNQEIRQDDWSIPLAVKFGENSEVLDCEIVDSRPDVLKTRISPETTRVTIHCGSMNPEDTFAMVVLVSNFQKVAVSGRVLGSTISPYPSGGLAHLIVVGSFCCLGLSACTVWP